jgi:hypothetical protein
MAALLVSGRQISGRMGSAAQGQSDTDRDRGFYVDLPVLQRAKFDPECRGLAGFQNCSRIINN